MTSIEHRLGKAEVVSSILTGSTICNIGRPAPRLSA